MKRSTALVSLLAAFLLAACAHMGGSENWVTLIDGGKGLENFDRVGDANWRVEDGAIVADRAKAGSFLVSKNSYRDFQIRAEFWAASNTNSGIFMRLSDPKKIQAANSYEVNIWDTRPDPTYGTAAIVDVAKVSQPFPLAGGKWNTFVITARGDHLVVEFNGQKTVDVRDAKWASGPFALQFANGPKDAPGGPIKWRKVQVRAL